MMIERKLIEQIVTAVLEKLDENDKKKNLFVVNAREQKSIEILEKQWNIIQMSAPVTIPEKTKEAVFLHVSQDLLVKAALGMTDTDESQLFSLFMNRGISITFIPSEELVWLLDSGVQKEMNQNYAAHLVNYKQMLEKFGVQFLSLSEFASTSRSVTRRYEKKLLTEKDVIESKSNEIFIGKKTIVTPLARDSARELAKKIIVIDKKE
ncbi:hypothetical protein DCC39_02485 [Pueribacillus theae]|uniref:Ethanolamine utilization protein n=1 Tax=Pueribacillus theae TaxID=2171751 RepID=A0A2U1K7Y3_9BACI|nr:hypothetical protein [Pueribacillus theae]PWA13018.1 hypothetical protein DCC39_02485 [Pueribacillus theae]